MARGSQCSFVERHADEFFRAAINALDRGDCESAIAALAEATEQLGILRGLSAPPNQRLMVRKNAVMRQVMANCKGRRR